MQIFNELYQYGGIISLIIIAAGALAFFLILERLFHLHRAKIDLKEFMGGFTNLLKRDSIVEAIAICNDTPGPVSDVMKTAIINSDKSELEIRENMMDTSNAEIPILERNMNFIATLAHIAPILGLLGTVIGMINAFDTISSTATGVNAQDLSRGIKEALYTTAAGLCVAIFAHSFYNLLLGKIKDLIADMEKASTAILQFMSENPISSEHLQAINKKKSDNK
jgi:biopolymer transport protein ExbB